MSQKLNIIHHFITLRMLHPSAKKTSPSLFVWDTSLSASLYLNGESIGDAFVLHKELSQYYSPTDDGILAQALVGSRDTGVLK